MIKIATPVSTLFMNPDDARAIAKASDCLERRDHSVDEVYGLEELFHSELELTQPWSDAVRENVRTILKRCPDLRLLSFHSSRRCTEAKVEDGMYVLAGEVLGRERLLANARENVAWLKSAVPASVTIALENNNYYPVPAYDVVTDGDFLFEVVTANDIAFLFDTAHARITARNKNIDYAAYVSSLPLGKTVQLHLCKPAVPAKGMARDAHGAPDAAEFAEAVELIKRGLPVRYCTIEYYKETPGLLRSIEALRKSLSALRDG